MKVLPNYLESPDILLALLSLRSALPLAVHEKGSQERVNWRQIVSIPYYICVDKLMMYICYLFGYTQCLEFFIRQLFCEFDDMI